MKYSLEALAWIRRFSEACQVLSNSVCFGNQSYEGLVLKFKILLFDFRIRFGFKSLDLLLDVYLLAPR